MSPFLRRSRSLCSELVCLTPKVYSEFMATVVASLEDRKSGCCGILLQSREIYCEEMKIGKGKRK